MSESLLLCARTACDRPAHPAGWNRMTHEMYCLPCARSINSNDTIGGPLCPLVAPFFAMAINPGSYGVTVLIDETKLKKPKE